MALSPGPLILLRQTGDPDGIDWEWLHKKRKQVDARIRRNPWVRLSRSELLYWWFDKFTQRVRERREEN